ncbi:Photosystem I subunit O [Gracilariopsis chorda]|uniref:Photosystem I subunit O n=1 Tax=Gracilariopsis chorda TaxID=448386 RepID=A0A2V3INA0_9FLOR|nr:Photosystem I subunit O [Gracilariopsis chorda]|eukprot:PXF43561.1 Photosystem I subunit O [Gracilariopsis chorda]
MAFISAAPLTVSSTFSTRACSLKRTAFVTRPVARRVTAAPARTTLTPRMEFEISEGMDFELNPIVIALAFFGWVLPSSIPTTIPLTNGTGLSQAFFASMQENLARWPKGPAIDDPFWLLLLLWHVGMFATLIFGTIGYNLSKNRSAP